MEMGETLYEWREREFFHEHGLTSYEFYVEAEAAHPHRVYGEVPTRIACWLGFVEGTFGHKWELDLCMDNAKELNESIATVTHLRDALNRVLAAIGEASEVVKERWEAEDKEKSS